jgi:hypothetical protein
MPNTVRLHRVLATKPDKVYRAFIEADAMAKWLPPNWFACTARRESRRPAFACCACPRLHHGCKGRVDSAIGAGSQHIDVPSAGGSSRLRVRDDGFSDRTVPIDQHGKAHRSRQQLLQQPSRFAPSFAFS